MNETFCIACKKKVEYEHRIESKAVVIRDKEYVFDIVNSYCIECGAPVAEHGLADYNVAEIDRQYRKAEGIVSAEDIENMLDVYNIGQGPLGLALGFGEVTIKRYLEGQTPSKEYSDIIKSHCENPSLLRESLEANKEKISNAAYNKAIEAISRLEDDISSLSNKMGCIISYIYHRSDDLTNMALQKLLYYAQGIYMALYDAPLYSDECRAWSYGPVYGNVYHFFKNFKDGIIRDPRFVVLKDKYLELDEKEVEVLDLVINTFGMYSGTTLSRITHNEDPWINARAGLLPSESSEVMIEKEDIKKYFKSLLEKYDLSTEKGINKYIKNSL